MPRRGRATLPGRAPRPGHDGPGGATPLCRQMRLRKRAGRRAVNRTVGLPPRLGTPRRGSLISPGRAPRPASGAGRAGLYASAQSIAALTDIGVPFTPAPRTRPGEVPPCPGPHAPSGSGWSGRGDPLYAVGCPSVASAAWTGGKYGCWAVSVSGIIVDVERSSRRFSPEDQQGGLSRVWGLGGARPHACPATAAAAVAPAVSLFSACLRLRGTRAGIRTGAREWASASQSAERAGPDHATANPPTGPAPGAMPPSDTTEHAVRSAI